MIDARADIHPKAQLGTDVVVGPWTRIGADVEIGDGTVIDSHVVIEGPCRIGRHNHIYSFASVGNDPQDKKFKGEVTWLEVGDHNVIRECCTLNRGTVQGGGVTRLGSHNLLMAYVHIAHDCLLGDHNVLANYVGLAGHVTIEDYVIMGGYAAVHQFCNLGSYSFIGGNCAIVKDVLPYLMVAGGQSPSALGLNLEGLKRHGFSAEAMSAMKQAYRAIFRQNLTVVEAVEALQELCQASPQVALMVSALQKSQRGILR
jgi:UDP-N-acetylglucosamine acyltransferase